VFAFPSWRALEARCEGPCRNGKNFYVTQKTVDSIFQSLYSLSLKGGNSAMAKKAAKKTTKKSSAKKSTTKKSKK
jgi:hypothetical protein